MVLNYIILLADNVSMSANECSVVKTTLFL